MDGYRGKISFLLKKYGYRFAGNNRAGKCPFCGGNRLFVDDDAGIWTCNSASCELHGGVVDFAFLFYTQIVYPSGGPDCPKNKKEAINLLDREMGIVSSDMDRPYRAEAMAAPVAPIGQRSRVYREMYKICGLRDADLKSLIARGYTEEQVRSYGYCSLPITYRDRVDVAKRLMDKGLKLHGCPGFELEKKTGRYIVSDFGFYFRKKLINCNVNDSNLACYLIPSYDVHANLQFFQIGWDKRLVGKKIPFVDRHGNREERDFAKYTLFSTPKKYGGGRVHADPGYVGRYKLYNGMYVPDLKNQKSIPVIEGTLKTALYFELNYRREACISQVGVSNYRSLERFLTEFIKCNPQIQRIDDCYDMDRFENPEVAKGSRRLEEICNKIGVKYYPREWDRKYKGIDDFALAYRVK